MTTPDPRTQTAVIEQQQTAVSRCLVALLRAFDWPCGCGHRSDQCTQDEPGKCDG